MSRDGLRPEEHRPDWGAQPLRLLFVTHSFAPPGREQENIGGMQRTAVDLHRALTERSDVELHTLALRTTARWELWHTPFFLLSLLARLPRIVRRHRIDVVLFTSLVTAAVAVPLARRLRALGTRTASIVHGRATTRPSPSLRFVVPRTLASVDLLLPVSHPTADQCARLGAPRSRITVVPNGVSLARFPSVENRRELRETAIERWGGPGHAIGPDDLIVCSVGRHIERKGFAWFVREVVPRLPETVHYWIAGTGPESPRIARAIAENGLGRRVRLLGRLDESNLALLYAAADLFVMPNVEVPGDFEGFGVVMLEAGASGLPVVAADVEGIRDVIRDGVNGHRVTSGDATAFAGVITRYQADRALLASDGQTAAAHVRTHYAWPDIASRYVDACRRVADDGYTPCDPRA